MKGVRVNNILYALGRFVDDMDAYLLFKRDTLQNVINEITTFEQNTVFSLVGAISEYQIYYLTSLIRHGRLNGKLQRKRL